MNTKDFIREHIKVGDKTKISKKLEMISDKHREFARYLDLIQRQEIGVLFFNFTKSKYIHFTQVSKNIQNYTYKRIIKQLEVEGFVELANKQETEKVTDQLEYNFKPKVYKLTHKGYDFINIDLISEYLEENYEV